MQNTEHTDLKEVITSTLVSDEERLNFLPKVMGKYYLKGESLVYAWMRKLCYSYDGGFWDFYELSNGGFFLAPSTDEQFILRLYEEEKLSSTGAGIVVTLFALGQLASYVYDNEFEGSSDNLVTQYHLLNDFIKYHEDAKPIWKMID